MRFGPPDPGLVERLIWGDSPAKRVEPSIQLGPGDCPACDGMGFYRKMIGGTVRCHHCHGTTMKPDKFK